MYYLKLKLFALPPTKLFDLDTPQRNLRKETWSQKKKKKKRKCLAEYFQNWLCWDDEQEGVNDFPSVCSVY